MPLRSEPDPTTLQPGDAFGAYVVDEQLGEGGMGIVFRAIHEDGAVVALKVLKPGLVRDEHATRRFAREARAAAEVDHPQLIDVIEAGDVDGTNFLAMRFVAGRSLDDRIREHGPLPLEDTTRIVAEIASALDALHAAGLVHRDVKPSNILLDAERGALLTDFGLAKSRDYSMLTAPGQMLGTLDYISPEMLRGSEPGAELRPLRAGLRRLRVPGGDAAVRGAQHVRGRDGASRRHPRRSVRRARRRAAGAVGARAGRARQGARGPPAHRDRVRRHVDRGRAIGLGWRMATLVITSAQHEGRRIEVSRELVIGRENVDVEIDDAELSRRHVAVRPKEGGLEVEDLGSRNGTRVDGTRIDGPTRIRHGAVLSVGHDRVRGRGAAGGSRGRRRDPRPLARAGHRRQPGPAAPGARGHRRRRAAGAAPARGGPAPAPAAAAPAPATAASNETAQPFGRYQASTSRRRRKAATRLWVPQVLTYAAVLGTAVGLVVYFA